MKEEKHSYIKGLLHGIGTLLTGMKVTGREFFTPKVTEQYPENRATLKISPRFRGRLIMPVDENGNNLSKRVRRSRDFSSSVECLWANRLTLQSLWYANC